MSVLIILGGLFWINTYIGCIILGFSKKTCAMPILALGLNLAWECIYTYLPLVYNKGVAIQTVINIFWLLLDIPILYTYIRYGNKKLSNSKLSIIYSLLIILFSFVLHGAFLLEFGGSASKYSAFLQNVYMSIAFIVMLIHKKSSEGQSLYIAITKFLGTLCLTISFCNSWIVTICGLLCALFDIIYIIMLYYVQLNERTPSQNTFHKIFTIISSFELRDEPLERTPKGSLKRFLYSEGIKES